MPRSIYLIAGVITILAGLFAYLSLFQVSEIEHAIVMQFGEPKEVISEPGLKYKHFWQDAKFYEKRTLNLDPPVETILLADQKRILVNAFTRYRIVDPLRFFQSVRWSAKCSAMRPSQRCSPRGARSFSIALSIT
jgi:membrane protease subunit HflC